MWEIDAGEARIPALGLGTWTVQGDTCVRVVRRALELGYRHVDTASMYGNEAEVGRGLRESGVPRSQVFLATKVWHEHLEPERLSRSLDDSLRRLGVDYVDLLLIHWPSPRLPLEPALDRMVALRGAGKIRHLGVSNFPSGMLAQAAARAPIVCDQVEYHPFLAQTAVLDTAHALGLGVVAYSPLARGKVRDDETLRQIGLDHGKTPAQVALRWLIQQRGVAAIPKASREEHLEENLEIFDFALSDDELTLIADLDQGLRLIDPPHAPTWDPPEAPVSA